MVSRKKAAGKARKAAKAKAKEKKRTQEAQLYELQEALLDDMQQLSCKHGADHLSLESFHDFCLPFVTVFVEKFATTRSGGGDIDIAPSLCLEAAQNATMDEYPDVWSDFAKMEMAISFILGLGAQHIHMNILDDDYDSTQAQNVAAIARYLERYIAVQSKQTPAFVPLPKLLETYHADMHTLVKFFRHRIPCSCLDEKYEEVKKITKIGFCFNPQCTLPDRMTERSKTMYCSRCRNATYCSRECQVSHWPEHKPDCDFVADKS